MWSAATEDIFLAACHDVITREMHVLNTPLDIQHASWWQAADQLEWLTTQSTPPWCFRFGFGLVQTTQMCELKNGSCKWEIKEVDAANVKRGWQMTVKLVRRHIQPRGNRHTVVTNSSNGPDDKFIVAELVIKQEFIHLNIRMPTPAIFNQSRQSLISWSHLHQMKQPLTNAALACCS